MKKVTIEAFIKLKNIVFSYEPKSAETKIDLLKQCTALDLKQIKIIKDYHGILIFIIAYPENNTLLSMAQNEMVRLASAIKKLPKKEKNRLERSGLPFTQNQGAYSLSLVKWLLTEFGEQITLYSLDETGIHPKEVLKHALPDMEFDLAANEYLSALKWLEKACGSSNKNVMLSRMVYYIEHLNCADLIKDQLFESLKAYIAITPNDKTFSKAFGAIKIPQNYYHTNGLLKRFNESELINKKLPSAKVLSEKEKTDIIQKARIALLLLNRETDPITYCSNQGLVYYELEHGLSIALFSMLPERRLPIDSYIGFMMFKNGHPMAYGGGWLFAKRSLIGVNIFESFRGGESAFVFCQLLRTYRQNFDATYFEVEPYQFGKNNPEGIKSGAFWFYYRFGFRPLDEDLRNLAEQEHQKIQSIKGYRSSVETLKLFTNSNLGVDFGVKNKPLDVSIISQYITDKINSAFAGDRKAAKKFCLNTLKTELGIDHTKVSNQEKIGIQKLSFFFGLCIDSKKLNTTSKTKLKNMLLEKSKSEFKYILDSNSISFEKIFHRDLLQRLSQ